MDDIQGTCGSYDLTALPDLVSLPLSKPKQTSLESTKHFSEKDGWELCAQELTSDSTVSKDTWKFDEEFHNAADKQQLSQHVRQTIQYINNNNNNNNI